MWVVKHFIGRSSVSLQEWSVRVANHFEQTLQTFIVRTTHWGGQTFHWVVKRFIARKIHWGGQNFIGLLKDSLRELSIRGVKHFIKWLRVAIARMIHWSVHTRIISKLFWLVLSTIPLFCLILWKGLESYVVMHFCWYFSVLYFLWCHIWRHHCIQIHIPFIIYNKYDKKFHISIHNMSSKGRYTMYTFTVLMVHSSQSMSTSSYRDSP